MRPNRPEFLGGIVADHIQGHSLPIDQELSSVLEIHGDPVPDDRLDLSESPVRPGRMTHQHAGFKLLTHVPTCDLAFVVYQLIAHPALVVYQYILKPTQREDLESGQFLPFSAVPAQGWRRHFPAKV